MATLIVVKFRCACGDDTDNDEDKDDDVTTKDVRKRWKNNVDDGDREATTTTKKR